MLDCNTIFAWPIDAMCVSAISTIANPPRLLGLGVELGTCRIMDPNVLPPLM